MLRNASFAAGFATCFLIVYTILLQIDATFNYAAFMLLISPVVIVWMAVTVIKHAGPNQLELNDEEFGYGDKDKSELGVF